MSTRRIFFLSLAIFILCAAGYFDTIDASPSLETAQAILRHGTFAVTPKHPDRWIYGHESRGARWYTKMGLAYPILYLPAAAVGRLVPESWRERVSELVASMVNPFVTAGIVALLYLFYLEAGVDRRRAAILCAVAAFATLLFPYSKSAHREPLQALCLVGVFVTATRRRWLAAGAFAGVGFVTKLALAAPLVPALIYAASLPKPADRARAWSSLFLPVLAALAAWALFARHAWGNPLATGYGPEVNGFRGMPWRRPFVDGIAALWWSPASGLFFFCPVVVLTFFGLRRNALCFAVVACTLVQTVVHAKWHEQDGALGPRFLVPIIPCLVLLWKDLPWRKWMVPVVAFSFVIQLTATSVKMQEYWSIRARSCAALTDPHWLANFKILRHKLAGEPEIYRPETFGGTPCGTIDLTDAKSLAGFNFWWLHALKR